MQKKKKKRSLKKNFFFSTGVASLPLFHHLLRSFIGKKNKAQEQNKTRLLYHQILMSAANFLLHQGENFVEKKHLIFKNTRDFVIEGIWMGTRTTRENVKATS